MTVLRKPPKKSPNNSNQIFSFKVITVNCNILVGTISQPMNSSQKISNRNSLQFHRYRCLNIAYGCISVPLQLHFQIRKPKIVGRTHIRRIQGWLILLREQHAVPIVLLPTHVAQIVHTVFIFFKSSDRMWERWFLVSRTLRIILQLARRPSFKTAATRSMSSFVFVVPSLPLHSVSSINSSPTANWLYHRNTIAHNMDESPNAFTNISHIFAVVNPVLQQNFIAARCSKFFYMVIYNTSTKHTILQSALILPHTDGSTSDLVCRWRSV